MSRERIGWVDFDFLRGLRRRLIREEKLVCHQVVAVAACHQGLDYVARRLLISPLSYRVHYFVNLIIFNGFFVLFDQLAHVVLHLCYVLVEVTVLLACAKHVSEIRKAEGMVREHLVQWEF